MPEKNFYFVRFSYTDMSNVKRTEVFYPECEAKNFESEVDKIAKRLGNNAEVIAVTKL